MSLYWPEGCRTLVGKYRSCVPIQGNPNCKEKETHCYAKGKSGCYLQKRKWTLGQQTQFLATISPKQFFIPSVIKII